jgi:Tfp pilus assembly PilM family ATPase
MNAFPPGSKRRLIAVDHGVRCVKLLLVESNGPDLALVDHKIVDLQEEGLIEPDEIQRHLTGLMQEWGECPLALTLPAHLSFSQLLDLPAAGEKDIPQVIEEQTGRLRDFSNSPLVYDAVPLRPYGKLQKPYFITIAREADVDQHIQRVTAHVNEVRDVASVSGALLSVHRTLQPAVRNGVVVDLGASGTVLAVVRDGQGVFASNFALGSNTLVEAVAAARKIPGAEAEALLRGENLFTGARKLPAAVAALDAWLAELRKVLDEWRRQNADWLPAGSPREIAAAEAPGGRPEVISRGEPVPVTISGGILQTPGLLACLQTQPGFAFTRWPKPGSVLDPQFLSDFAVAYGTALEAFQRPLHTPSLLPPLLRAHRLNLRRLATVNAACIAFLALVALLLVIATWQKVSLLNRKRALGEQAGRALAQVEKIEDLTRQRNLAFEQVWPLLDRQERTLDLLHTLRTLQESRAQKDFWCVLVADQDGYARGTTLPVITTNRFGVSNTLGASEESLLKPAFIVELCVPATGEQTLKVVSDVVADLKKNPLFSRVDSVPKDQRRALVDPKVLIPDRYFAVSVELADLGWRHLLQTLRLAEPRSSTNIIRRATPLPVLRPRALPGPAPAGSPLAQPDA